MSAKKSAQEDSTKSGQEKMSEQAEGVEDDPSVVGDRKTWKK